MVLCSVECENGQFSRAAEAEREPAGVASCDVAVMSTVAVHASRVLEWRDDRLAEEAELRAVGMACQCQECAVLEALIDEIGMMGQKDDGSALGIPANASSAHFSSSISFCVPLANGKSTPAT